VHGFRVVSHLLESILYTDGERPSEAAATAREITDPSPPGARTQVHEIVRRPHHFLIVLNDQDRVPRVAQPLQCGDQACIVSLVKADGRLVEHVANTDHARTDVGRQANPLHLAAGKRGRRAVECQVVQPDAAQKIEPAADSGQYGPRDPGLLRRQFETGQELPRRTNGHARDRMDRLPTHGDMPGLDA